MQSVAEEPKLSARILRASGLEAAAQSLGLNAQPVVDLNRAAPDPRLAGAPEVVGAMFAAPVGKVIGPVRTLAGWYFARVDARADNDTTGFAQMRGQVAQEVLTNRQRAFFNSFVSDLLAKAKVQDLREETTP